MPLISKIKNKKEMFMKHLILALLTTATVAAHAQSNVTIYGAVDATVDVVNANGASNGASRGTFNRVSSNSSFLGFKGSEELGNGLSAIFQLESGVALDTNGGVPNSGRTSFVGLSSRDYGTVVAGLLSGPTRNAALMVDQNFGNAGPGLVSSIVGKPGGGAGTGTFDTRFSNAIAYISPSFNGLTVTTAYTTGENKSVGNARAANVINTTGYDIGVTYERGRSKTALTHAEVHNRLSDGAIGTNLDQTKITRLATVYSFDGGHKLGALVEQNKNVYSGLASAELSRITWGLTGKYAISQNGAIIGQYFVANSPNGSFYMNNDDRKASLYELGYEHRLSKRTVLKTAYTVLGNQANSNFDFATNAVAGGTGNGTDYKVLSAGIRHLF